ncbi:hypothetical protein E2C01_063122 [Portunus trituberculatus]|uniref:Uncharacterized protein n=1 Tax=Portunus trituberculatus TaxID=210409 RepID=A0A5B7H8C9_PORTR|nr:hypothetical protein [Portunus trituberculatus]
MAGRGKRGRKRGGEEGEGKEWRESKEEREGRQLQTSRRNEEDEFTIFMTTLLMPSSRSITPTTSTLATPCHTLPHPDTPHRTPAETPINHALTSSQCPLKSIPHILLYYLAPPPPPPPPSPAMLPVPDTAVKNQHKDFRFYTFFFNNSCTCSSNVAFTLHSQPLHATLPRRG